MSSHEIIRSKNKLEDKVKFLQVRETVNEKIYEENKNYFEDHIKIFRKMTDNMFDFTYTEEEFKKNFSDAISFFAQNLSYNSEADFPIKK